MGHVGDAESQYVGDRATYLKALFNDETGQTSEDEDVAVAVEQLRVIRGHDDERHKRKRSAK